MEKALINAKIFSGETFVEGNAVLIRDNYIIDIIPNDSVPDTYWKDDLQGNYLVPGFIDLQIYGGNGHLFASELTPRSLEATYNYSLAGGATYFMVTIATNSPEVIEKGIELIRNYWASGGKGLLGLHLEGPFINQEQKGAHEEKYIHKPTLAEVKELVEKGRDVIKMITLAPELVELPIIDFLLKEGIHLSAGHSKATYEESINAFNNGIKGVTHLYNAMSPLHHRHPGMVGAAFEHPEVMASIIADGVHVDFMAARVAKKMMGNRLFFITDAVTTTQKGTYKHVFKGNSYTLPDGTLSGSSLSMIQAVKNGINHMGLSLEEALRMASLYPAKFLHPMADLGKIEKGYQAAMVVLNTSLDIEKIYC